MSNTLRKFTVLTLALPLWLAVVRVQAAPHHPIKEFSIARHGRCVQIRLHVVGAGSWQLLSAQTPEGPFEQIEATGKSGKRALLLFPATGKQRFFRVLTVSPSGCR